MANAIKMLIWLHKSKQNKNGLAPLMIRLSYKNIRKDKASGFYINPLKWNSKRQTMKGNDEHSRTINGWIKSKGAIIAKRYSDEEIDLEHIMESFFATTEHQPTILETILVHNEQMRQRLNKDYTVSTYISETFELLPLYIENNSTVYVSNIPDSIMIRINGGQLSEQLNLLMQIKIFVRQEIGEFRKLQNSAINLMEMIKKEYHVK
jgi:hypothetical protein